MAAALCSSLALGFTAPPSAGLRAARSPAASVRMASIEELPGASVELGGKVWDPYGFADLCPYGSENFEWMRTAEVKHGRVCMAASVGWIIQEMGFHFSGDLAHTPTTVTFAELSQMGAIDAWKAVPDAGKWQVLAVAGVIEIIAESKKPHYMKAGLPTFEGRRANSRLSELKNGRAAMVGVASFYAATVWPSSVPLIPTAWH